MYYSKFKNTLIISRSNILEIVKALDNTSSSYKIQKNILKNNKFAKSETIQFRCTPKQKQKLQEKAEEKGIKLPDYIRKIIFK